MSSIRIQKIGITKLKADAVVNAANSDLWEGGGVCGYIFQDAGASEMTKASSLLCVGEMLKKVKFKVSIRT